MMPGTAALAGESYVPPNAGHRAKPRLFFDGSTLQAGYGAMGRSLALMKSPEDGFASSLQIGSIMVACFTPGSQTRTVQLVHAAEIVSLRL